MSNVVIGICNKRHYFHIVLQQIKKQTLRNNLKIDIDEKLCRHAHGYKEITELKSRRYVRVKTGDRAATTHTYNQI